MSPYLQLYNQVNIPCLLVYQIHHLKRLWWMLFLVLSNQLDDYYARGFLHELDHLNGVLFTDNVSPLLLNIAKRRHAKLAKRRIRR